MKRLVRILAAVALLALVTSVIVLAVVSERTFHIAGVDHQLRLNSNSGMGYVWDYGRPALADSDKVVSLAGCDSAVAGSYTFSAAENLKFNTAHGLICARTVNLAISGEEDSSVAAIPTGNWVLTGTNVLDEAITETYATAANTEAVLEGEKAFKTLVTLTYPADDGNTGLAALVRYSVGTGPLFALPFSSPLNGVEAVWLDGTLEATAPAVTFDRDEIEKNTFNPSTAVDSSKYVIVRCWIPPFSKASGATPTIYGY